MKLILRTVMYAVLAHIFVLQACRDKKNQVSWRISEPGAVWQETVVLEMRSPDGDDSLTIQVDPTIQYQQIDGWGGSFNEQGYAALLALDPEERKKVIRNIFDPDSGLKFNICRTPVAASDFTVDNIVNLEGRYDHLPYPSVFGKYYSYDDFPGDFAMEKFSVDRDTAFLIPYIRMALEVRPDLKVWASPWTPPQWMKTDFHEDRCVAGECWAGYFRGYYGEQDTAYSKAYARYFARYLEEYEKHGIPVYALHVQNEFSLKQYWTSCVWTGSDLGDFYAHHLLPLLRSSDIPVVRDAELWHGTIHPQTREPSEFGKEIKPAFEMNPGELAGVGFQWKGVHFIDTTKKVYPDIKLMATETRCGNGSNDWDYAQMTWEDMHEYLTLGVHAYMQWNMILDHVGKSSYWVGFKEDFWEQSAMITINTQNSTVRYNPQFFAVKHFSYYVKPGARRIASSEELEEIELVAFLNPDHSVVIELINTADNPQVCPIDMGGKLFEAEVPAQSFNTFVINP